MSTILSLMIAVVAALFLMWINGRQRDFDQLQNKSE